MPINPVHVALMNNGKVLIVSGSGNDPSNTNLRAAVWDPASGTYAVQTVTWDMFCNGMVVLPDGRPVVMGGTLQYDPFYGQKRVTAFDPVTGTFADLQNMAHGRWYPTATTLGDGRVMTFSGSGDTGATNNAVEIFTRAQVGAHNLPPPGLLLFTRACIFCRTEKSSTPVRRPLPDSSIQPRTHGRPWATRFPARPERMGPRCCCR